MGMLTFLILFPLIIALALLFLTQSTWRRIVVIIAAVLLTIGTIYLQVRSWGSGPVFFQVHNEMLSTLMLVVEILLGAYLIYLSIKNGKYPAILLVITQLVLMAYFEFAYGHDFPVTRDLFLDRFSIIMALIIGIIGSLICVYSLGYMKDYHHHHAEVKNRTPFFFFIIFVFLSAMFGVVFSNNLLWLYFFWEITTICSFLLIGYTQTKEAINNAFKALVINLLGGIALALGIVFLYTQFQVLELDKLLALDKTLVILPIVLLSFAGLTKSAQFPFSGWLLGAMVAPTPTSALLHSSTMVKAGVYLILRLAPLLQGTLAGNLVAWVGAVTFMLASFIAISQLDAKKVLAYSTIANLGLIVACGGIGNIETVWAGIFLIMFHAIAKSALFLSVGPVEHNFGDRNIETMEGLILKAPKLAIVMSIGIVVMFIAPFGMLISKWAALEGVVKDNPFFSIPLAYGSAATLFFWSKWLGKIITVKKPEAGFSLRIYRSESWSLYILAALALLLCLVFPLVSTFVVEPYLLDIYGSSIHLGPTSIIIVLLMLGLVILLPLRLLFYKDLHHVEAYLGGTNVAEEGKFRGSLGLARELKIRNYYLENYFSESRLFQAGVLVCSALIIISLGVGLR